MAKGGGHGVSDAVRGAVREWMTDRLVDILFETATSKKLAQAIGGKILFSRQLRASDSWVRISRKRSDKYGVWQRTYYSKIFGKGSVGLTILTNKASKGKPEDMHIESVTITMAGKVIGGGRVSVPSVQLSQWGKQVAIKDFQSNTLFKEFTSEELEIMSAKLTFGDDSILALFEDERVV